MGKKKGSQRAFFDSLFSDGRSSSSSSEYGGGYSILGMSIEVKKSSGGQLDEGTHLNRKHQGGRHGSSESGKRQSGDGKRGTRRLKGGRWGGGSSESGSYGYL